MHAGILVRKKTIYKGKRRQAACSADRPLAAVIKQILADQVDSCHDRAISYVFFYFAMISAIFPLARRTTNVPCIFI
jgi:hypothetical protein